MSRIDKTLQPVVTRVQDRMQRLSLFRDKVNGLAGISTWEAVDSALNELEESRKLRPPTMKSLVILPRYR